MTTEQQPAERVPTLPGALAVTVPPRASRRLSNWRQRNGGRYRELVGVSPVVVCLLLPLTQIGGAVYLYDIFLVVAILVLGFAPIAGPEARRFDEIWKLFIGVILLACVVAVVRSNGQLRPLLYTVQYLLAVLYVGVLYTNFMAGRLDLSRFSMRVILAGLALCAIAVAQFVLFQINQPMAEDLYRRYLELSGYDPRFFEQRYLKSVEYTGMVRVMGTWDVATTFAGMLVITATWLLIARLKSQQKLAIFSAFAVAALTTGARHAWIISVLLLLGLSGGNSFRRLALIGSGGFFLFAIVAFVDAQRSETTEVKSFTSQISSRFERTIDQGTEDTSIQLRYVEGTLRFVSYALQDPSILIVGLGTGTEKAIFDAIGSAEYARLSLENDDYGFVSNGWLLIWRNWGLLGLIALLNIFAFNYRLGGRHTMYGLVIVALVIGADNYSVHVARCFFLILVLLTAFAADGSLRSSQARLCVPTNKPPNSGRRYS